MPNPVEMLAAMAHSHTFAITGRSESQLRSADSAGPVHDKSAVDTDDASLPQASERIRTGARLCSLWLIVPLVLATALLAGAPAFWSAARPLAIALLAAGVACLLFAAASGYWIRSTRKLIVLGEDHFQVGNRSGMRTFRDEQVVGIAVREKHHYVMGEPNTITYTTTLGVRGNWESDRLSFRCTVRAGDPNPLSPLTSRIQSRLIHQSESAMRARQPVEAERWALQRGELLMGKRPHESRILLDELAAAEVFDGKLCLWTRGEVVPSHRIGVDGDNVWLLEQLLKRHLSRNGVAPREQDAETLGRLFFQRTMSRSLVATCLLIGFAAIVGGFLAMHWGVFHKAGFSLALGGVIGLCGMLTGVAGVAFHTASFRCYEHGVCQRRLFVLRTLRYRDVESLSFSTLQQFVNSVYSGTVLKLELTPSARSPGKKIHFRITVRDTDAELEWLRDHIAAIIATRMVADFAAGKGVRWTPQLRIQSSGILHQPRSLLGHPKHPTLVPFTSVTCCDIEEGQFRLWTNSQERAVLCVDAAEPNFYAGFRLLQALLPDKLGYL